MSNLPSLFSRFRFSLTINSIICGDAIRLLIFRRKLLQTKYNASFSPRQMRERRPNNAGIKRFLQILQLDMRKGNTCTWTDALLKSHFRSNGIPGKIGLFTSPHFTNERKLGIYEINIGGRWDSTNCWDDTVVCGFNTIGFDHTPKFGRTIPEIARNKAGIIKPGYLVFSVLQIFKLEKKSNLVGCLFIFINDRPFRIPNTDRPELFLKPVRNNFALAIKLADAYLKFCLNSRFLNEDIIGAVHIYDWPNRFQMVENPGTKIRFYLNSPANFLNILVSFDWFITQMQYYASVALPTPFKPRQPTRILIFGYDSTHRDVFTVARAIANHCYKFKFAFNKIILTSYKHPINGLRASETMGVWEEIYGSPVVSFAESVEDALENCSPINDLGLYMLITGYTDLVSSALPVLITGVKLKLNKFTSYNGTSGGNGIRL
ncbi:uncharacterized protein PgNI_12164 [Pyricularia grisea]|uniref:Uncharacterized protein n=1 Tax=Pyricularia grisea TaxID=148305 RepID=A0A6P8AQV6_PYRGI|nr:uncharacterized protein PgNI_12164 [Pyricularia grisea]TLD04423.1 hypothetical protein PgNI_12164 [Pyricularia grisea]